MILFKNFKFYLLFAVLFTLIFIGCNETSTDSTDQKSAIRIAVFSDPHLYDPSLGTSGAAFEAYLAGDRKMIAESKAILEAAIDMVMNDNCTIILIPGDLTKDGEKHNHLLLAEKLKSLEQKRKRVFVIPGNHDILNPNSVSYLPTGEKKKIEHITPLEFAEIYKEFGFGEAKYRDNSTLTYIAELNQHFWLFAIDACIYENNQSQAHSTTGGLIKTSTLNFILEKLAEAKSKNIIPIGMIHHGIVEHFPGQSIVFADYLVKDFTNIANAFADAGLKIIFSGHHHAQDISKHETNGNFIFDCQVGSTVTYPCPVRFCSIDKDKSIASLETSRISKVTINTGNRTFQEYALYKLLDGFPELVKAQLMLLGASKDAANLLEPIVTTTFVAYYQGDEPEQMTQQIRDMIAQLKKYPDNNVQLFTSLLEGIWYDTTPDNNVEINLKTGTITKLK